MTANSLARSFDNHGFRPFHSSGYARTAQGHRAGAAAPQSFGDRLRIERTRQVIGGYHQASVVHDRGVARSIHRQLGGATTHVDPGNARGTVPTQPRRVFSEPSTRQYNPFA